MVGTFLIGGATGLLAWLGYVQSSSHRRNLQRIPIRIHVNGTRGKSSVTRLIAAGLRAGGIRTLAKTTGTLPCKILPDGSEQPIVRVFKPNVIEQVSVIQTAIEYEVEAIVMECMALQPALQSMSELQLVRSTHGVITNARPDHLDVMGPTPNDVARALAGTVPVRGTLFTAEQSRLDIFARAATDRQSKLVAINSADVKQIPRADLQEFSYIEHPVNIALALAVCRHLGINREVALRGMWSADPDVGVMRKYELCESGRQLTFINGFAANDPESTEQIWNLAMSRADAAYDRVALVNCRDDRPDRSRQLAELIAGWSSVDRILVVGSGTSIFARRALALGLASSKINLGESWSVDQILKQLRDNSSQKLIVVGIGNIGGTGMQLERFLNRRRQAEINVMAEVA